MTRREFPRDVIRAAWRRCEDSDGNHRCEKCGALIWHGNVQFDHVKAHALGGESTLENAAALCRTCHNNKTVTEDRPVIQKADNQGYASLRQRKPWHPDKRKKLNGSVVERNAR